MRGSWLLLVLLLVGCGGGEKAAPTERSSKLSGPTACHALLSAPGYRGCGRPYPSQIERGDGSVVVGSVEYRGGAAARGFWRTAMISPDGKTLLAQWSGECELQKAFFVAATGGASKPVTGEADWATGPESEALGWEGARARVRLPKRGEAVSVKPGIYLIDPRTFRRTLVRPIAGGRGCS